LTSDKHDRKRLLHISVYMIQHQSRVIQLTYVHQWGNSTSCSLLYNQQ